MEEKKTVFISGPVTGVPNYWETFEQAEELINGLGYTALVPSRLPMGMTNAQYMRICFAMIDSADVVVFLPTWEKSAGSQLERAYCKYTDKPYITLRNRDTWTGETFPENVTRAWLEHNLKEVVGE